MLSPDYLRRVAEGAEEIAAQLHAEFIKIITEAIVTRMRRGVSYRLTARDRWMLEVLQAAGYIREDLMKEIAAKTRLMRREIRAAFEDAAVRSLSWDDAVYLAAGLQPTPFRQSPVLQRIVERGYEKTAGEWENFTGTTADASQRLFIRECDKAYNLVMSGGMSHAQAVRRAVEAVAREGVTVKYTREREDGSKYVYHTDTIETATLRAVRTGVSQACGDITDARMDELDWDTILTSAHLGAREGDGGDNWTNHYWWQGRFFSKSGNDRRFPPFAVCGYGYVDGIHGANCRHSHGPGDGVHNPFEHFDSEANRLREEQNARQRLLERRIRKSRREAMALQEAVDKAPDAATREEAEAAYRKKAKVLMRQEKEYDDFCKENGLRKLYDRLQVAQYGPRQVRAAEEAAGVLAENTAARNRAADEEQFERYRKILGDEAPEDLAAFQQMKYNKTAEWEDLKGFYRYKKSYPSGTHQCYAAQQELAAAGIKKGVLVPAEPLRAYILPLERGPGRRGRDPWHITKRMQERNVTDDALRGYVENARAMFLQWGDGRRLYASDEGMCVTVYRSEYDDWVFKSTWTKHDYDADSEMVMEVLRKHGL